MTRKVTHDGLLFWAAMIAIGCAALLASRGYGQEPTNLKPYDSLVELRSDGGQGTGTLVYIKPGTDIGVVLTARHVAKKPYQELQATWLWAQKGRTKAVTYSVAKGSKFDTDMALVACRVPDGIEPTKVVPFDPANGPWIAAGYRDKMLRVTGPLYSVRHTPDGKIIVDEPFIPGMSGGFICDRYGRVVGVIVAKGDGVGVCSDGENLQQLLKASLPE